ncbi:hypothetical protein BN946_scf184904.g3 [Trametes cinnabarina]|uniref:Uncharacterized protein n=1 Tax=Pycnoporus cinnabarinus TaxID=5643 RepID=A0A060SPU7_PYCCI|nr:hypothetical protein BN946_scf184904.g3 [Trametes cinnabarina]
MSSARNPHGPVREAYEPLLPLIHSPRSFAEGTPTGLQYFLILSSSPPHGLDLRRLSAVSIMVTGTRVDCKAAAAAVDPRKRAKKSVPTVDDDDDDTAEYAPPATSSRKSGKKMEKAKGSEKSTERSAEEEKGKGKGKVVARTRSPEPWVPGAELGVSPGEGSATLALAREGRAWSTDPESLSDRELIEHLLVEGQRTRLALHKVWRHLDEEVEVREDMFASDLRDIRAGVRSSIRTELSKMEAVVREVVRDEVAKALAASFGSEGSSSDAEKEDEAEMEKEGEGSGTGAGEREKEGEKEDTVADPE